MVTLSRQIRAISFIHNSQWTTSQGLACCVIDSLFCSLVSVNKLIWSCKWRPGGFLSSAQLQIRPWRFKHLPADLNSSLLDCDGSHGMFWCFYCCVHYCGSCRDVLYYQKELWSNVRLCDLLFCMLYWPWTLSQTVSTVINIVNVGRFLCFRIVITNLASFSLLIKCKQSLNFFFSFGKRKYKYYFTIKT